MFNNDTVVEWIIISAFVADSIVVLFKTDPSFVMLTVADVSMLSCILFVAVVIVSLLNATDDWSSSAVTFVLEESPFASVTLLSAGVFVGTLISAIELIVVNWTISEIDDSVVKIGTELLDVLVKCETGWVSLVRFDLFIPNLTPMTRQITITIRTAAKQMIRRRRVFASNLLHRPL